MQPLGLLELLCYNCNMSLSKVNRFIIIKQSIVKCTSKYRIEKYKYLVSFIRYFFCKNKNLAALLLSLSPTEHSRIIRMKIYSLLHPCRAIGSHSARLFKVSLNSEHSKTSEITLFLFNFIRNMNDLIEEHLVFPGLRSSA